VRSGSRPVGLVAGDFFESVPSGDALVVEQQYARLLAAGGFTVQHVIPCGDRFSLIQARPA
jgi:hypothetical protein